MDGVVFLLSIIAIGFVCLWCRKNDGVSIDGKTVGLLAMPSDERKTDGKAGNPKRKYRFSSASTTETPDVDRK